MKPRLALEADAGPIRQSQIAILKRGIVGEAAEIAEHAGIGFGAAEAEAAGDRERHLVAAMREHQAARPLMARQHLERAGILRDAVGLRRIDLNDVVALWLQSAEAGQVFDILGREQILPGRKWC